MSSHQRSHESAIRLLIMQVSPARAVAVALGLFVAFRAVIVAYRLLFHPLRTLPGPKLWAASDLPYIYSGNVTGTSIRKIASMHKEFGPIVRIGPDRIALDGSIGWPEVFARRSGSQAEYEKAPHVFSAGMNGSLIARDRESHRRQRRTLDHAFSDSAMYEQESIIESYINMLVVRIREHAIAGKELDIVKWLNFTTFDIIGDLTYGEAFGSLESSNYHPWVLSIFQGFKGDSFVSGCNRYPLLGPIVARLFGGRDSKKGMENRLLAYTKCKARMAQGAEPKGRRDFMTYMLQPNSDGKPGLMENEIMANSPLLIVAGSETTASALSGLFFYLNQAPRAKRILIEEIRSAFQDASEINMISTNKLVYLHAALEESLRMYPPAASTPARMSPGAEIDGKFIPKDASHTRIHVTQWAIFRNPQHFHAPETYCPERWLKQTHPLYDHRFDNDNRAVFKPFSHGPRDCIGKNLAYSEIRLIVCQLLFNFDVELLPGPADWHDMQTAYGIWDKGPLYLKFAERKTSTF